MKDDKVSARAGERDEFARVMRRDGFSPDLPQALAKSEGSRLSLGLRLLLYMLSGLRVGTLDVRLPDGTLRHFAGSDPGPHGVLHIKDGGGLIRHVLHSGEVGIGDAYLDDCWESPDLTQLLITLYRNEPYYKGPFEMNWLGRFTGWVKHRLRANTKRTARRNIEHHYDLGNEFYKLWLDDTLAYSSALFTDATRPEESLHGIAGTNESLRQAQLAKFQAMLDRLDLRAEHALLEIGSGWGGFAIFAAQQTGCRVHSITLSQEQLAEAQTRAHAAGVGDRIRFELRDYRDLAATYDRVVSIEMYEAVGEEYWPTYFDAIARALKPGGRAAIQGITISPAAFENYRRKRDFIQKYIFPGGMLCPPGRFMDLARSAGLAAEQPEFFARDYADTLLYWHCNVLAERERIVRLFDERFLRMWRYYLSYCETGFRTGTCDLMQVTLLKI